MLSVFPIAYFGSISYFQQLVLEQDVAFEIFETYPKHSTRNHCKILSPNGVLDLIVPLKKPAGSKTATKDVLIDYSTDWQKKHWKSFESAYSSSPYFDHYGMEVKELILEKHESLMALNKLVHERICSWLDLDVPFTCTTDFAKEGIIDFRSSFKTRNEASNYHYQQVFSSKKEFIPDLSMLDAIFNLGPMARKLIISK
jgi:hypothetical protein